MSDSIIKIIPRNHNISISKTAIEKAKNYLSEQFGADKVVLKEYKYLSFIDCGSNLEEITCPSCGKIIPFDLWGKQMSISKETAFTDLTINTPCCNTATRLDKLNYNYDCGFSKFEIDLINCCKKLSDNVIAEIEKIFSNAIKIIYVHY